jgi:hypothetical protein
MIALQVPAAGPLTVAGKGTVACLTAFTRPTPARHECQKDQAMLDLSKLLSLKVPVAGLPKVGGEAPGER